jgi:hypothetical protein
MTTTLLCTTGNENTLKPAEYTATMFIREPTVDEIEEWFNNHGAFEVVRWDESRFVLTLRSTGWLVEVCWTPTGLFVYVDD